MSQTFSTDGLVLREQMTGERDRIVKILTASHGVIRAFVNGAKSSKSRAASGTDLLCYSHFSVNRSEKNVFSVREATPLEVFFELRQSITLLALGQYIAEIFDELSPREGEANEQLKLALNALSLLSRGKKSEKVIKAATELRLLTLAGYMPSLVACSNCGTFETDLMAFDSSSGLIFCRDCMKNAPKSARQAPLSVITAMRFICFSEREKLFSFSLPDPQLDLLNILSEKYLKNTVGHSFKTLDFYHRMVD